jgi:hypothetical protein
LRWKSAGRKPGDSSKGKANVFSEAEPQSEKIEERFLHYASRRVHGK